MVLYKDAIYCVGLHTGKGEIRTFLLDRMRDTESSALERFELPADFRVDDYFQGGFGIWRGSSKIKVVIDFDAAVAELVRSRRIHETQKLATLADGTLRLTMTVGDLTELSSWVLGWGRTARVVEPEALASSVKSELEGALARYGSQGMPLDDVGVPHTRAKASNGPSTRRRGKS
jgi:predicted DNA-binding transcriptional regulator YafY